MSNDIADVVWHANTDPTCGDELRTLLDDFGTENNMSPDYYNQAALFKKLNTGRNHEQHGEDVKEAAEAVAVAALKLLANNPLPDLLWKRGEVG